METLYRLMFILLTLNGSVLRIYIIIQDVRNIYTKFISVTRVLCILDGCPDLATTFITHVINTFSDQIPLPSTLHSPPRLHLSRFVYKNLSFVEKFQGQLWQGYSIPWLWLAPQSIRFMLRSRTDGGCRISFKISINQINSLTCGRIEPASLTGASTTSPQGSFRPVWEGSRR